MKHEGGVEAAGNESTLAGMSLPALRNHFQEELFERVLPFWDKHGIDHEAGGVMCSLDYDGRVVNTDKLLWFQGRAIWVYSFLYNHFGQDPKHLEIARRTRDFVLQHALQEDGWWAERLTREGKVIRPFDGDIDGVYFIVEGLQEYAAAARDDESRDMAIALMKRLFGEFDSPAYRYRGLDFPHLSGRQPAVRPQGTWMLNLGISSQMLRRWRDPEIEIISDRAVEAIVNRHYNPEIGLNTEMLHYDFTRPAGEERKSKLGHCIEALWMLLEEADRRHDDELWAICAERIHHHLEVGWDHVYGGLSQWVNVDSGGYEWPPETPVGTNFAFRFVGEYNYMKALWGLNEVLIATLAVYARTKADWAAKYFSMAFKTVTEHFSLAKRGLDGYVLFADRRMTFEPHSARQDNYHPIRQLMLNLLTLERMEKQ